MEKAIPVKQIYPEGAAPGVWVFVANTVPPRYVMVDTIPPEDETPRDRLSASDPLSYDQMLIAVRHSTDTEKGPLLTREEHQARYKQVFDYGVDFLEMQITGNYPGGKDRAAYNLARAALGA